MVRHKTEEGNHLILYRTVAWPEELLHPCKVIQKKLCFFVSQISSLFLLPQGLPRSGLDVSGYYVEPLGPEECRITKILQVKKEKQTKEQLSHLTPSS